MQIHRIRGNDLNDALSRAKRTHGESAVVIGHERTADGGITLAVTVDGTDKPASAKMPISGSGPGGVFSPELPPAPIAKSPSPQPARTPKPADVVRFPKAAAQPIAPARPVQLEEVAKRLASTGASADWIERTLNSIQPGTQEHPLDQAGRKIGEAFRIARLPKTKGTTRVLTLVGPTGSGKTSGLIKIGARLVRGGHKTRFASLDSKRVGAIEQLGAYAGALGVEARALAQGAPVNEEAIGAIGSEVVLLDTAGRPAEDCAQLLELRRSIAAAGSKTEVSTFLVLPANLHRAGLLHATSQFGDTRLAGCIITKLDETPEPAHVLEYVAQLGLPIAFLSDGRDLGRSLHRATPEALADLFLRGRLK